jgi:hypothetical protein
MRVLVVIFGGLDHQFLAQWKCPNLQLAEWGPVVVDELWNQRDVATQITAQLITGKAWYDNGVPDRKKRTLVYKNRWIELLETRLLKHVRFTRGTRQALYEAFRFVRVDARNYMRHDLVCPSLFEQIENSYAVYVPAYNPEPSWALDRNILDPRRFPEFGVEGALDLREKNFQWRRRKFMAALDEPPRQLLMGQFQYIDSTQHLYLSYHDSPQMEKVEEAYWRMDQFAGEILAKAKGKYDRVLFLSDNGAARKIDYRPTHYNRPYYAVDSPVDIDRNNLRDFYHHILDWVRSEPNPGVVNE